MFPRITCDNVVTITSAEPRGSLDCCVVKAQPNLDHLDAWEGIVELNLSAYWSGRSVVGGGGDEKWWLHPVLWGGSASY